MLVDAVIANTPNGIVTSLAAENSTSFLLQNVGFFNVQTAVKDSFEGTTLIPGGDQVLIDSCGFGKISDAKGAGVFINGANIPAMTREPSLLGLAYTNMKPNLFTRRRPKYYSVLASQVLDVKALGAKGDGITDDTVVLNAILEGAANTTSIVYFPLGVYIITDTLRVPVRSRIIGQAWSQIIARGAKFGDELNPKSLFRLEDGGISALFGLAYSSECWCGGAVDESSIVVPDEDCGTTCSGDEMQMCGGPNRLSMYLWS